MTQGATLTISCEKLGLTIVGGELDELDLLIDGTLQAYRNGEVDQISEPCEVVLPSS